MLAFMLKTKGLTLIYSAEDKDHADERIPLSELGKIDVDVEQCSFTVAKTEKGITLEGTVRVNISKK
jgi:hypothetical protein